MIAICLVQTVYPQALCTITKEVAFKKHFRFLKVSAITACRCCSGYTMRCEVLVRETVDDVSLERFKTVLNSISQQRSRQG